MSPSLGWPLNDGFDAPNSDQDVRPGRIGVSDEDRDAHSNAIGASIITELGVPGSRNIFAIRADGKIWISTMFYMAPGPTPKQPKDWEKAERTKEYIRALAERLNIAVEDMIDKDGESPFGGRRGWWVHPKLLVDAARYISVNVRIVCDEIVHRVYAGRIALEDSQAAASIAHALGIPVAGSGGIRTMASYSVMRTQHAESGRDVAYKAAAESNKMVNKLVAENTGLKDKVKQTGVEARRLALDLDKSQRNAREIEERRRSAVTISHNQANLIENLQNTIADKDRVIGAIANTVREHETAQ
jgi:cell division septum initiation protein DivIVA